MKLTLEVPMLKPIGVNHSHMLTTIGRHARRIKTTATKNFEKKFDQRMDQYQDDIDHFNNIYNPERHHIVIDYRFYIPVMKKNKKSINQRSGDVDGLIKVAQDCLFKKLKADDSAITFLTAAKIHSEKYNIVIDISLRDISYYSFGLFD